MFRLDSLVKSRLAMESFASHWPEDATFHSGFLCFYHTYGDPEIALAADVLISKSAYSENLERGFSIIKRIEGEVAEQNYANAESMGRYLYSDFFSQYDPEVDDFVLDELGMLNKNNFLWGDDDLILSEEQLQVMADQHRCGYAFASFFRRPIELEISLNCKDCVARSHQSLLSMMQFGYDANRFLFLLNSDHCVNNSFQAIKSSISDEPDYVISERIDLGLALVDYWSKERLKHGDLNYDEDYADQLVTPLDSDNFGSLSEQVQHQVECLRGNLILPIIFDLSSIRKQIFAYGIDSFDSPALFNDGSDEREECLRHLARLGTMANKLSQRSIKDCANIVSVQSCAYLQELMASAVRNIAFDSDDHLRWITVKKGRGDNSDGTHVCINEEGVIKKGPPPLIGTKLTRVKKRDKDDANNKRDSDTDRDSDAGARPLNWGHSGRSQRSGQSRTSQGLTTTFSRQAKRNKGVTASTKTAATAHNKAAVAQKGQSIQQKTWMSVYEISDYNAYPFLPPQESPEEKRRLEQEMKQRLAAVEKADPNHFGTKERVFEYLGEIAPRTDFSTLNVEAFSFRNSQIVALCLKKLGEHFPLALYYLTEVVNCQGKYDRYYTEEVLTQYRATYTAVTEDSAGSGTSSGSSNNGFSTLYHDRALNKKLLETALEHLFDQEQSEVGAEIDAQIEEAPSVSIADLIKYLSCSEETKRTIKQYLKQRQVPMTQLRAKHLTPNERAFIKEVVFKERGFALGQSLQLALNEFLEHANKDISFEELFVNLGFSATTCALFVKDMQRAGISVDVSTKVGQLPEQVVSIFLKDMICNLIVQAKEQQKRDVDLLSFARKNLVSSDAATGFAMDASTSVRGFVEDHDIQRKVRNTADRRAKEKVRAFAGLYPNGTFDFYVKCLDLNAREHVLVRRYQGLLKDKHVDLDQMITAKAFQQHLSQIYYLAEMDQEVARKRKILGLPVEEEEPREKLDADTTVAYFDPYNKGIWLKNHFFYGAKSSTLEAINSSRKLDGLNTTTSSDLEAVDAVFMHELFHFVDDLIKSQLDPYRNEIKSLWLDELKQWGKSGPRPVALQNPSEYFAERCAEYCVAAPQVRAKNPNIKRIFEIALCAYAEFVKAQPSRSK